jgi:hypothetical protein
MPRLKHTEPRRRLTIELPVTVRQTLEELRDKVGADTMSEVVRRALLLYDHVLQAKKAGSKLIIKRSDGDEAVEFF